MPLAIGDLGWRLMEAHWLFGERMTLEYGYFRKISGGRLEKSGSGQTVQIKHDELVNGFPAVAEVRDAEDKVIVAAKPAILPPTIAPGKAGFRNVMQWLFDNQADSRVPRVILDQEAAEEV